MKHPSMDQKGLSGFLEAMMTNYKLEQMKEACSSLTEEKNKSQESLTNAINRSIELLDDKGSVSDGSHTFGELYYHRMVLFSLVCKYNKSYAWKSKRHYDRSMYPGYFIVGIDTALGQYSYHYPLKYWDYFEVEEREKAPEWDGHSPQDVTRLFFLDSLSEKEQAENNGK